MVFDKTGNVGTFYNYQAHVVEVAKLFLNNQMGTKTKEEVLEEMRKSVVSCVKMGKTLVFNFGKLHKDMAADWSSSEFPAEKIFNWAEWRKPENHMAIVKEDENVDLSGNTGQYVLMEKFTICCLFDYTDDDTMAAAKNTIPDNANYLYYIVQ